MFELSWTQKIMHYYRIISFPKKNIKPIQIFFLRQYVLILLKFL